jgi:hypothetical protein
MALSVLLSCLAQINRVVKIPSIRYRPPFLSDLIIEWPTLDGHVPFFKEVPEVFFIDAVMPAGQPESF